MVLGERSQSEKRLRHSDPVTLWKRLKWFPGAGRGGQWGGQWSTMVSRGWTHVAVRFSKAVDWPLT